MRTWAFLAAGGLAGVFLRWAVFTRAVDAFGEGFPWGTLLANVGGCFLAGLFAALSDARGVGLAGRLLLLTGFCGGLTTFSALIHETSLLLGSGRLGLALLNYLGTGALGLLLYRAGAWLSTAF